MIDYGKPLHELTPAEVASEMVRLRLHDAELDRAMADHARNMERLKAESNKPSIGIYDPNADPVTDNDAISSEVAGTVKYLIDSEQKAEQEAACLDIRKTFERTLHREYQAEKAAVAIPDEVREDVAEFVAYCRQQNLPYYPAPAEAVILYLAELCERPVAELERRVASISLFHRGFSDPAGDLLVKSLLRRVRNEDAAKAAKDTIADGDKVNPQDEKGN